MPKRKRRIARAFKWMIEIVSVRVISDGEGDEDPWPIDPEAARLRTAVFSQIYKDGQEFARHYDEKLRTLITALSFLTVAGITLFIFSTPHGAAADLTFDGRSWNAGNAFFVIFLLAIFSSVASAAAGMDPSAHRPHFFGNESENRASMLYFESIAADDHWDELITLPESELEARLAISYARDARALARRAQHKVMRTAMAQAYLSVATIALVLLGLVRLPESSATTRATMILLLLFGFSALPRATLWLLRRTNFPTVGPSDLKFTGAKRRALRAFYWAPPLVVAAMAFSSYEGWYPYWPTIGFALAWICLSRIMVFSSRSGRVSPPRIAEWVTAVGVVIFLVLLVFPSIEQRGENIHLGFSNALNANETHLVCIHVAGRPNTEPVVTFEGGAQRENQNLVVPLNADGQGFTSVPVPRAGSYRFTARAFATDVKAAQIRTYKVPAKQVAPNATCDSG
jgi:hypothetical protein